MSDTVEAYQKWLGIPAEEQPPSHYRLLGLEPFESDRTTIDGAAKRLMGQLQKQLTGPDQAAIRKLLDQISDARRCLLLNDRKTAYDQKLRASLKAAQAVAAAAESDVAEPVDAAPVAEPIDEPTDVPMVEPIDGATDVPMVEPLPQPTELTVVESLAEAHIPLVEPVDVPPVEPIDGGAADEIPEVLPIQDEAVPEATPIADDDSNSDIDTAPEPELIHDAVAPAEPELPSKPELIDETSEAPQPELIDEALDPAELKPTLESAAPSQAKNASPMEQAPLPRPAAASQPTSSAKSVASMPTLSQPRAVRTTISAVVPTPSTPLSSKISPPGNPASPKPIAAAGKPNKPAAEADAAPQTAGARHDKVSAEVKTNGEMSAAAAGDSDDIYGAAAEGEIDGSFFSGMGLSGVRAGGATATAAGSAGAGFAIGNPASKPAGASKNAKPTAKSNLKANTAAGAKSAGTTTRIEGKSIVKKPPRKGPEMWQIMVGVGGGLVVLMVVVAAMLGNSSPTTTEAPKPAATHEHAPQGIAFGPRSVTGAVDDRTTRSPVTGSPIAVPIERHGDLMLANVKINDQPAGTFLLDTGTRDIIIGTELADRLALSKVGQKSLSLVGGVQQVTKRKINSLSLGLVRFEEPMILPPPTDRNWLAVAADLKPWSAAIGVPIDGVIGCDIWSQLPFSIDPSKNTVTFFKREPLPFSAGLQPEFLTRFDFKPAMPAMIDNGPEGTFLIATGAPTGVMVKGLTAPVGKVTFFGQEISAPASVESKNGDGYFDPKEVRQSGVIGAQVLSHFVLMFDFQYEKFLAVPIKK